MSSKRAKTKTTKKRPQRATSNVFAMFDQSQIQEFKEAFNMIDQNRDGFIDKEDLHDMLASLGNVPFLFTVPKQIYYNSNSAFGIAWIAYKCLTLYCTIQVTFVGFSLKAKTKLNVFLCRKESNGRIPRCHDERGPRTHQFHDVPHNVW